MRLIDANVLKKFKISIPPEWLVENKTIVKGCFEKFGDSIDAQPIIEAEPVVHGYWIKEIHKNIWGNKIHYERCSACNTYSPNHLKTKYCSACGAKMDKD